MAFVFRSERVTDLNNVEETKRQSIGPGTYPVHETNSPKRPSRQPFKVQTGRAAPKQLSNQTQIYVKHPPISNSPAGHGAASIDMGNDRTSADVLANKGKSNHELPTAAPIAPVMDTPGPGAYKSSAGFDNIKNTMQSAQTLVKFGLDHKFGIQVMKPSGGFASKTNRFQADRKAEEKASHAPGPGSYAPAAKPWVKHNYGPQHIPQEGVVMTAGANMGMISAIPISTLNSMKDARVSNQQLLPNPPSIPSHDNVFGYEINNKGELVRQPNPDNVYKGTSGDCVGPQQYDPTETKTQRGITKWKPPQNQRIEEEDMGAQNLAIGGAPDSNMRNFSAPKGSIMNKPGPGSYDVPDNKQIGPGYKQNRSSMFASGVNRVAPSQMNKTRKEASDVFVQIHGGGKYNVQKSSKIKPKTSQMTQGDILLDDSDDDNGPGPGAYHNQEQSCFNQYINKSSHNENMQFFGSTVERFSQPKNAVDKKIAMAVGPGAYEVPKAHTLGAPSTAPGQIVRNPKNIGFINSSPRFNQKSQTGTRAIVPGPGAYKEKNLNDHVDKRLTSKNGVFGTSERRFVPGAKLTETPGPGRYIQANIIGHQPQFKQNDIKRSSSMFIQRTRQRNEDGTKSSKQSASALQKLQNSKKAKAKEIVQYDSHTGTIADGLKKEKERQQSLSMVFGVVQGSAGPAPIQGTAMTKANSTASIFPGNKLGFASNAPRFQAGAVNDESEQFLGPGYYEATTQFGKVKTNKGRTQAGRAVQTAVGGRPAKGIITRDKRSFMFSHGGDSQAFGQNQDATQGMTKDTTAPFDIGASRDNLALKTTGANPGPGHYSQKHLTGWVKRSYNVNFTNN